MKGIELARLQIAKARLAELQRGKWPDWPRQEELSRFSGAVARVRSTPPSAVMQGSALPFLPALSALMEPAVF